MQQACSVWPSGSLQAHTNQAQTSVLQVQYSLVASEEALAGMKPFWHMAQTAALQCLVFWIPAGAQHSSPEV